MDLLDPLNTLDLYDKDWRIYTRTRNLPPQYLARGSVVKNALVNEGCYIRGTLKNSILFSDVVIEEEAVVVDSVVHSDCVIEKGARVYRAVVSEGMTVKAGQVIGQEGSENIYLVSEEGISVE
jgi:glucose-1-phosphate adenylyltransferase